MQIIHKNQSKTFFHHNIRLLFPLIGLTTLTFSSAAILSSPLTLADTQSLSASVRVPDTCSMNAVPSDTGTIDNPYEIMGGVYRDNVGSVTLRITCNDHNGYSLYAVGYGNDTAGNTNMIGDTTEQTIPTGLATDASASNWAMKLAAPTDGEYANTIYAPTILSDASGSFLDYHLVPSTDTKVATFTGDINILAESVITTTYAVGVDSYQTPDTYTGKVKYTLVHPNYSTSDGALLPAIQDLTLSSCMVNVGANGNPANIGDNLEVYDVRDGNIYTIRYIHGKCWMTKNLRFTGKPTDPSGTMTLDSTTSNVSSKYIASSPLTLNYYDFADTTQTNCRYSGANASNPLGFASICLHDSNKAAQGVWYNFAAASAGTITGYSNSSNATESLCPAGWHLPSSPNTTTGTDSNIIVGNTVSGWQDPTPGLMAFGGVSGGNYSDSGLSSNSTGYWWSATAASATHRYNLLRYEFTSNQFKGDHSSNRTFGFFVRCVAD